MKKKALLITGEGRTGKTTLAKRFATFFKHPLTLNGGNLNPKMSIRSEKKPDVIIIESIRPKDIEQVYSWITEGVTIHPIYKAAFHVTPQIIVTCLNDTLNDCFKDASFFEHFHVIELNFPPKEALEAFYNNPNGHL